MLIPSFINQLRTINIYWQVVLTQLIKGEGKTHNWSTPFCSGNHHFNFQTFPCQILKNSQIIVRQKSVSLYPGSERFKKVLLLRRVLSNGNRPYHTDMSGHAVFLCGCRYNKRRYHMIDRRTWAFKQAIKQRTLKSIGCKLNGPEGYASSPWKDG